MMFLLVQVGSSITVSSLFVVVSDVYCSWLLLASDLRL